MADIRIKDLATTASSTASDDFLAVDGTTNGTRKLNAFSPTFGGNVVATGTLTVNSTTDSSSKDTGAIITEGGLGVEKSATIGGNLTVSGTGTSSFAGPLTVSLSQNADTELRLTNTNAGASARAAFILTGQASSFGTYVNNTYVQNYTPAALDLQWWTSGTQHLTLKSGGNLLLGTTTDSANGKLQLATHTTSAGGIGFGTEFSLFRKSSDTVVLNNTGTVNVFKLAEAGTDTVYLNSVSGVGTLGTATAKSLVLATNGTTALTLDSSQNATFAGIVKGNSAQFTGASAPGSGAGIEVLYSANTGTIQSYDRTGAAYKTTAVSGSSVLLQSSGTTIVTASSTALSLASGKALQLGNAYTAGAPTATGYVTIQDSTGTTYKVLVGT